MCRAPHLLGVAVDRLSKAGSFLSSFALVGIVLLVIWEITLRNVFSTSSVYSAEFSIYLLVFITFASMAEAQRSGTMIHMELILCHLSPQNRRRADIARHTVSLLFGLALLWYVTRFVWNTCSLNQLSLYTSQIPLCVPQSSMVLGLILLDLQLAWGLLRALDTSESNASTDGG